MIEVMVISNVGIEVRLTRLYNDLAKQSGLDELIERVVNRRQRHVGTHPQRFAVQNFCINMPAISVKQELRKCQTLTRGY